ncbi:LPS-assembly protein LptD [Endozoicomonas sp. OPT23]|uniref:LPS-assembly protein LptD n=1 Tax=Endozoicomonas sp. OPT23 TaxID=2072845 RepID=UPI00189137AD|nr:LPS-assembly protein LptD [Endozoicomonas sp. OPT23]
MHQLPFKPRTLTLAIAAVLISSQPVSKVMAETTLSPDEQWNCSVSSSNNGWSCSVAPVKQGDLRRAPRPAPIVTEESFTRATANQPAPAATTRARAHLREQLDWVPKQRLPEKVKVALEETTPWCDGRYVEPDRPGKHFKGNSKTAPIVAESDQSSYDEESVATLTGNVTLRQGSRQVQADTARLDRETNFAELEGNVVFREPGTLLTGDHGDMMLETGRATIKDASYVMHEAHVRGDSSEIVRNEDAVLELNDATYTSCKPGDNGWKLSGDSITLDPNTGFGTAKNAVVRVKGLPIFYTPYIYFPIDDRRQSGFLYPTIAFSDDNGMDLTAPYYWNIAPNYDATITPRYMAKRGLLLENELRYMNESGKGEVGVAGLVNKDQLEKDNPYQDKDRWLANIRYQQNFSRRWTADLDYADASDKNYINDFGSNLNLSNTAPLNQKIGTQYQGGNDFNYWSLKLEAQKFKNMSQTSDDPYNKLPQLVLDGHWQLGETLNLNYLADYTHFQRADDWRFKQEIDHPDFKNPDIKRSVYDEGYGIKRAQGGRTYAEAGISYPMESLWGFLTPEVKVRSVNYNLKDLVESQVLADLKGSYTGIQDKDYTDSPKTNAASFSLDSGLFFDRFTNLFGNAYTHTFEPRAKYLYVPYKENQEFNPNFDSGAAGFSYGSLWRDNRFNGYDRIGDTNQIALGFTTRLIDDSGFEKMRFGLGQIFYFDDRKVFIASNLGQQGRPADDITDNYAGLDERTKNQLTDSTSPLASEFVYNFTRTMSLKQDFSWNTNENRLDNYNLAYQWNPEDRKVVNLGYRFQDRVDRYILNENDKSTGKTTGNNLSQADFSFAWPLAFTRNWGALGRYQYDITNKRNLEQLAGVEYTSCCYQVRLFWRSWIESDDNIDHPDPKKGIFLQFVLSGLGNITGNSGTEYLQGIKGYKIREK